MSHGDGVGTQNPNWATPISKSGVNLGNSPPSCNINGHLVITGEANVNHIQTHTYTYTHASMISSFLYHASVHSNLKFLDCMGEQ